MTKSNKKISIKNILMIVTNSIITEDSIKMGIKDIIKVGIKDIIKMGIKDIIRMDIKDKLKMGIKVKEITKIIVMITVNIMEENQMILFKI